MTPPDGALWAAIAIVLVLLGALLTVGVVSVEQRAIVLAAMFAVLAAIAYRRRRTD